MVKDHDCDWDGCENKSKEAYHDTAPADDNPNGYFVQVRGTGGDVRDASFMLFCSLKCAAEYHETNPELEEGNNGGE